MTQRLRNSNPLHMLLFGYGTYILVGWGLLNLPFSVADETVGAMDHLFIAVSAVSTTGLATVSPPDTYSFFGELVILGMIQFGGIGYMTLGSFVLLARKHDLPETRLEIAQLSFSLPEGFRIRAFVRNVMLFTFTIEAVGAAALYAAFRSEGVANPGWQAIFHSVSAFCTAGFSLFPDSLERFVDHFWVNAIISALSLLGATGFLVMSDLFMTYTGQRQQKTLTTRIILYATFWALCLSWLLLFLIEPTVRELPSEQRLMASGFQAMTALTTVGFNTIPIGGLSMASSFLLLLVMIMGASPSGTGGGLKSTSVSAAFATVWSTLKARDRVTFWGCEVPQHRLTSAFAALVFYVTLFFAGGFFLLLLQDQAFEDVIFEAASALGTVGISRGITGDLTPLGKLVVIALMFIGRVGPITFGLALFSGKTPTPHEEDLAI